MSHAPQSHKWQYQVLCGHILLEVPGDNEILKHPWLLEYHIYSNKHCTAYLIFHATSAVLIWGRHLLTLLSQVWRLFEGSPYSSKYGTHWESSSMQCCSICVQAWKGLLVSNGVSIGACKITPFLSPMANLCLTLHVATFFTSMLHPSSCQKVQLCNCGVNVTSAKTDMWLSCWDYILPYPCPSCYRCLDLFIKHSTP